MYEIKLKLITEQKEENDGFRIFIDNHWPKNYKKKELEYDMWLKNIAPSIRLRDDYGYKSENEDMFRGRYMQELYTNKYAKKLLKVVKNEITKNNITFLYTKESENTSHAFVLKDWILRQI